MFFFQPLKCVKTLKIQKQMGCSLPTPRCGPGLLWADGFGGPEPWLQDRAPPLPGATAALGHSWMRFLAGAGPQGPSESGSCSLHAPPTGDSSSSRTARSSGPLCCSCRGARAAGRGAQGPQESGALGTQQPILHPAPGGGTHTSVCQGVSRPSPDQGGGQWVGGLGHAAAPGAAFPLGPHLLTGQGSQLRLPWGDPPSPPHRQGASHEWSACGGGAGPSTAPIRPLGSQMEAPAAPTPPPRADNLASAARGGSCEQELRQEKGRRPGSAPGPDVGGTRGHTLATAGPPARSAPGRGDRPHSQLDGDTASLRGPARPREPRPRDSLGAMCVCCSGPIHREALPGSDGRRPGGQHASPRAGPTPSVTTSTRREGPTCAVAELGLALRRLLGRLLLRPGRGERRGAGGPSAQNTGRAARPRPRARRGPSRTTRSQHQGAPPAALAASWEAQLFLLRPPKTGLVNALFSPVIFSHACSLLYR